MIGDLASIPGAGGLAAAAVLYAGVSLYVTGPLVGERLIERSGWQASCERGNPGLVPRDGADGGAGDCAALLGLLFGRDGIAFCRRHGEAIGAATRLAQGLSAPGPRAIDPRTACACAVREVLDWRRTDFALHAGSLRLVTPRPVRDLGGELGTARSSPACAGRPS